jgi:imidazolonepropionase-like amidohydrolase
MQRVPSRALAVLVPLVLAGLLAACGKGQVATPTASTDPFPSTYAPLASRATLIRNATVLTGTGARIDGGSVLLRDGKVVEVGTSITAPEGAEVVDATGKWVTPGVIDVHSHLGVYPEPAVAAHQDGNESVNPVTAEVWAEHGIWPQDPGFVAALQGGVTAMQILPGSANLIGGRGVTLKNVPARTMQAMKFPGAKHGLKMACGENPKRVYGGDNRAPKTRMGNVAGYRAAWIKAKAYKDKLDKAAKGEGEAPDRDLQLESLKGVLDGEIIVHNHCYKAEEMAVMIDIAREFGYRIGTFHHAVESYKVADLLAKEDICSAMWADWYGFKMEAFDGVRENMALVEKAGACAIVHSDSGIGIQHLNQEAAKSMASGNRAGIPITREQAIRWITANAAKSLGIADRVGTLEAGKQADVVVWSGDPFSVYSKAERVFIDGATIYDRLDAARQPVTDFSLGLLAPQGVQP